MDNPILTETLDLSNQREVEEAQSHLRAECLRLYLVGPPWPQENIRQRAAICLKMGKWKAV